MRRVWSRSCLCLLHLRSKQPPVPSIQTHSPGSKYPSFSYLFLFGATTCSYKNAKVEQRSPSTLFEATHRLPRSHLHRHNRHISITSLPEPSDQWPALTTSPIPMKKSSSKLNKPNCLLNNTHNRRQNNLIPMATCGDFCFHAVRGSGSSTSGGHSRHIRLAVVMIMRSVCLE